MWHHPTLFNFSLFTRDPKLPGGSVVPLGLAGANIPNIEELIGEKGTHWWIDQEQEIFQEKTSEMRSIVEGLS